MPEAETELKVIHRRSQVIRFNKNILRNAVADPSIMEVITFNSDEIAILGLGVGTTSLTIWFENVRDPVVFLIETIRDPSLEDRKRHDYGQLEKKLALVPAPIPTHTRTKPNASFTCPSPRVCQNRRRGRPNVLGCRAG